jgi:phosphoglycerol transferase MdoB-like AlkP superfamily enzyme
MPARSLLRLQLLRRSLPFRLSVAILLLLLWLKHQKRLRVIPVLLAVPFLLIVLQLRVRLQLPVQPLVRLRQLVNQQVFLQVILHLQVRQVAVSLNKLPVLLMYRQ